MCLADEAWDSDDLAEPESMSAIDRALQLDSVAPQWYPDAEPLPQELPQRLSPLRENELAELEAQSDEPIDDRFSSYERELLRLSVESLDYLGDWSDERAVRDSIVLCCESPEMMEGSTGPEFTCTYSNFTAERHQLHSKIIELMLTSARTRQGGSASFVAVSAGEGEVEGTVVHPLPGGPPALRDAVEADKQHVFIVVGVPGSGKDTVLKRYLRSLGMPLLDASADLIKECALGLARRRGRTRARAHWHAQLWDDGARRGGSAWPREQSACARGGRASGGG